MAMPLPPPLPCGTPLRRQKSSPEARGSRGTVTMVPCGPAQPVLRLSMPDCGKDSSSHSLVKRCSASGIASNFEPTRSFSRAGSLRASYGTPHLSPHNHGTKRKLLFRGLRIKASGSVDILAYSFGSMLCRTIVPWLILHMPCLHYPCPFLLV